MLVHWICCRSFGVFDKLRRHQHLCEVAGVPSLGNYSQCDCDFQEDSKLPRDEYAQYLVYKKATASTCTATLAQLRNNSHYLLSSTANPWIINSGANEHMTGESSRLSNYKHVGSPISVTLVNGSLASVHGTTMTHLTLDIDLCSVLQIPGFPFSLLSISKITKSLHYSVNFYPRLCIFRIFRLGG